jgi:hypothetical protein
MVGTTLRTNDHHSRSQVGNRSLLTTVRDPLDHWINGWIKFASRGSGEYSEY